MSRVITHSAAGPRRPDAPSPHEPIWPLLYPAKNDPDYVEVGYGGHFVRREIVERYEGVFVPSHAKKSLEARNGTR
jgi:hypothetical protein